GTQHNPTFTTKKPTDGLPSNPRPGEKQVYEKQLTNDRMNHHPLRHRISKSKEPIFWATKTKSIGPFECRSRTLPAFPIHLPDAQTIALKE
ncbi:MAG: hypothetical protein VX438_15995, partial [Planctomycetota bacterium]|nr:hypothetical protein [Planctomycetota bacterium]